MRLGPQSWKTTLLRLGLRLIRLPATRRITTPPDREYHPRIETLESRTLLASLPLPLEDGKDDGAAEVGQVFLPAANESSSGDDNEPSSSAASTQVAGTLRVPPV